MLDLIRVAVTGGLAAGKTTVCSLFKELGSYVVDADAIVHHLLSPHSSVGQQVIALLGKDILNKGQIDRGKIARIIFNDEPLLNVLQNIIHPVVMREIEKEYQKAQKQPGCSLFVAEIPLLFEIGGEKFFDHTITVATDPKIACKRFAERGLLPKSQVEEAFIRRSRWQLPLEEKIKKADFLIENSGNLEVLRQQVYQLHQKLLKSSINL